MKPQKNLYFTNQPVKGKKYKLWQLPTGTTIARENLKVDGRDVNCFQIVKQLGNVTYNKTDWNYIFHLDASLDVIVI